MQLKKTNQKQTKKHLWSFRPQKVKDFNSNQTNKIGKCYPYNFDCGSFIDKLYYVSRFLFDW